MSLKSFKETLKNTQPSSSRSPSKSSHFKNEFSDPPPPPLRKPPKSSISQQLRRCNHSLDFPSPPNSLSLKEKSDFEHPEKDPSLNSATEKSDFGICGKNPCLNYEQKDFWKVSAKEKSDFGFNRKNPFLTYEEELCGKVSAKEKSDFGLLERNPSLNYEGEVGLKFSAKEKSDFGIYGKNPYLNYEQIDFWKVSAKEKSDFGLPEKNPSLNYEGEVDFKFSAKEKSEFGLYEKNPSLNYEEEIDEEAQSDGNAVSFRQGSSNFVAKTVRGPFEPLVLSSPGEFPLVQVSASINCRLLDHQRVGVKFLYELYKKNHGGVLGDDMGLGKTVQTIAFLVAMAGKGSEDHDGRGKSIGPVLIVCPTSVIRNWENEFQEWSDFLVAVYHGPNRDLVLDKLQSKGFNAVITSFDTLRIHGGTLAEIKWEIVVYDEAHRLKNERSRLYKACLEIKTRRRFGLTGTIMQNKIMELFNLFDLLAPGSLGTREHFHEFYDEPLKHGQRASAPERFVSIAEERRRQLSIVLQKYLLRRTKEETIGHLMLGKEDNVVFCAMSDIQRRVYRRMLAQPEIECLVNKDLPCSCGSPLTRVECCHRIIPSGIIWSYLHKDKPEGCESCPFCVVLPCLMKLQQISNHLELIKPNPKDEIEKQKKDAELASVVFGPDIDLVGGSAQSESFMSLSDVDNCGKMKALDRLLSMWISSGDKVLLFSYSVRMLDILDKYLIRKGFCFSRLDGSTPMSLRQTQVDEFNRSPSRQVFLISTRAGGLGLNLVSANRVVIFDPNWNPSQDLQAQDRSFRYGQKRHVVVFRLLAAGSVEELVYTRQVYKQQLSNIAVSGKMERRYFEGVQDCKEFQGELFGICNLFRDLSDKLFTSEIVEPVRDSRKKGAFRFLGERSAEDNEDLENKKGVTTDPSPRHLRSLDDMGIVYAHRNEDVVNAGLAKISEENTLEQAASLGDEYSPRKNSFRNSNGPRYALNRLENEVEIDATRRKVNGCSREKLKKKKIGKMDEFELKPNFGRHVLDENLGTCSEDKTARDRNSKRTEYELIAAKKGMELVEFSRWVLAASPFDLQEVLLEHYKGKTKRRKGNPL